MQPPIVPSQVRMAAVAIGVNNRRDAWLLMFALLQVHVHVARAWLA
jgi:hypothetical protein